VTPRRNPEIVVACLFEGGEHGALAAQVATKVIKAYVEKQRNRQTQLAKAAAGNKAEVAAVWHDSDAKPGDNKLQGGHFTVALEAKPQAKVGTAKGQAVLTPSTLEATESHTEMSKPEPETPAQALPMQPGPKQAPSPAAEAPNQPPAKKPAAKPSASPAVAIISRSDP
jgi:hypothetical protein